MLGSLAEKPESSFPAMGWPGTKAYRPSPRSSLTPWQMSFFTPQASVRIQPSLSFGPHCLTKSRAASG